MVYGSPGTQFDVEDFESVEIIFKYKAMKKINKYYNTHIMLYQGSIPNPEQSDKYAGTHFYLRGGEGTNERCSLIANYIRSAILLSDSTLTPYLKLVCMRLSYLMGNSKMLHQTKLLVPYPKNENYTKKVPTFQAHPVSQED